MKEAKKKKAKRRKVKKKGKELRKRITIYGWHQK